MFRHTGACLTLLCNTVEENLRGMKERMKERKKERKKEGKNDIHSGFLILDVICQGDICPGNISPDDICPWQQYLSSY